MKMKSALEPIKHDATMGLGLGIIAGMAVGGIWSAEDVEALTHYLALQLDFSSITAAVHASIDQIVQRLSENPHPGVEGTVLNALVGGVMGAIDGAVVGGAIGTMRALVQKVVKKS